MEKDRLPAVKIELFFGVANVFQRDAKSWKG
jgi:hypothetical protein